MTSGLLLLLASVLALWWMAGSRSAAYLLYGLSFVPFVSLDTVTGGLQRADGLDADSVLLKAGLRLAATAGIAFLCLTRRRSLAALASPRLLPVLLFVAWAFVGLVGEADPLVPIMRLGELASFVVLGALLWSESARASSARSLLRWHAAALVPLLVVTTYYALAIPGPAVHVDESGIVRLGNRLINAETLGTVSALVVLWASFDLREPRAVEAGLARERLLPLGCLALALATLFLARSRTAMIATFVGEAILWFPWRGATLRRWTLTAAACLAALVWASAHADGIVAWFLRGDSVDNFVSGTGRTALWGHLVRDVVPEHPLLGNGYLDLGAPAGFQHAGTTWTNAHNAYLAALIYTGIPGLLLFLAVVLQPVVRAGRAVLRGAGAAWMLFLAWSVFTLLSNATSFGLCGWPNPLMLFVLALYPSLVLDAEVDEVLEEPVPGPALEAGGGLA